MTGWGAGLTLYPRPVGSRDRLGQNGTGVAAQPVSGLSQCHAERGGVRVQDNNTGRPGAIFYTGAIRWKNHKAVSIESGTYACPDVASGNTLFVTYSGHKWVITAFLPHKFP